MPDNSDLDSYEKTSFGWRKKLSDKTKMIVIESDKHTGLGVDSKDLNELGLRGHPSTKWERITHLGYLGDEDHDYSLLYKYLDSSQQLQEKSYKIGDVFYSVSDNDGYWHLLINGSKKPVKLLIEREDK